MGNDGGAAPGAIDAAGLMSNLAIVLVEPKYPENIGAAARVAVNNGISRLLVVREEPPDREKMLRMATHNAAHLIEELVICESLAEALAGFSCAIGTTAREGRARREIRSPRQMAEEVVPLLRHNRVALVFGREDRGLTNEELLRCAMLCTIPTANFSSLNLAQAVAVSCYELFVRAADLDKDGRTPPKLAEGKELEEMYRHVDEVLRVVGFLRQVDHEYWMRNIRQFLGRAGLRAKEARMLRGVCRQFLWHEEQRESGKGSVNGGL